MKRRSHLNQLLLMAALVLALLPVASMAQGAKIRMPDLSGLAEKATDSVDISLDGETLKSAGNMFFPAGKNGARDPQFDALLEGLEGVYVKTFEFDKPGQYSMRDIETVIKQVERDGWKKLLSVRDKEDRVEMWIREDDKSGGMFFVASEPDELVLINIVGKVNLQALMQMGGRMGMPNLSSLMGGAAPQPARPAQPGQPGQFAQPAQPAQFPQPAQPAQPAR